MFWTTLCPSTTNRTFWAGCGVPIPTLSFELWFLTFESWVLGLLSLAWSSELGVPSLSFRVFEFRVLSIQSGARNIGRVATDDGGTERCVKDERCAKQSTQVLSLH